MFDKTARPANLDSIDVRRLAQPKMKALVVRGFVAAAAHDVSPLPDTARCQVDRGSYGVTRTLRSAYQRNAYPVVFVGIHVAQQDGRVVDAVHHNGDLAVVEEITEGSASSRDDIGQPGTLYRGNQLETFPLVEVVKQQGTLREGHTPIEVDACRPAGRRVR